MPEFSGTKTVLATTSALLASLPPGDKKVAQVILDEPEAVIHMTVVELASRAGTAESTTIRCCRKLGYTGFQDLKIRLARELSVEKPPAIPTLSAGQTPHDVLRAIVSFNRQLLDDVNITIESRTFNQAAEALLGAGSVLLTGFGFSYFVCLDAQDRLSSIGINARAPEAPNMKLLQAHRLKRGDVLICVSHTGATKEILRYVDIAKHHGASSIGITSSPRSKLARVSDYSLAVGGRELDFRIDSASARIVHLSVLDSLYLALAQMLGKSADDNLSIFHDEESVWRL